MNQKDNQKDHIGAKTKKVTLKIYKVTQNDCKEIRNKQRKQRNGKGQIK